jgi:mRNA interferase YafQ
MYAMKKSNVNSIATKDGKRFKYSVYVTDKFKKDFVDCYLNGLDTNLLVRAVEILATEGILPEEYKSHTLLGDYKKFMKCHIQPEWILVWQREYKAITLLLTNTDTHSCIFG